MAIFYVSAQTGNDSDNGTSVANAKLTVQAGLDLMTTAGDVLYIAPGTYRESVNCTTAGNAASGDHKKVIGDPDCEIFTEEEKGIVRITQTAEGDINESNATYGTIYANKLYWEWHNLHVDGGGWNATLGLTTNVTSYGIRASSEGYSTAYNCISQASYYGFYNFNTVNCIGIGGNYGFYNGKKHVNSISYGSPAGFAYIQKAIDCIAIGGNNGGFYFPDSMTNCFSFGGGYGVRANANDEIYDSIFLNNYKGIYNQGSQGSSICSGSYVGGGLEVVYRPGMANCRIGPGWRRWGSSTAQIPNSTGWTLGDNNIKMGPGMFYSYNRICPNVKKRRA